MGYKYCDEIVGTMPNLVDHVGKILGAPKLTHCVPMGVDDSAFLDNCDLFPSYEDKFIPRKNLLVGYAGTIGTTNAGRVPS